MSVFINTYENNKIISSMTITAFTAYVFAGNGPHGQSL